MAGQARGDVHHITGDEAAEKLALIGITWTRDLLTQGASPDGRREIATRTGVETSLVLEWVNRADLMRVPGISARWADLLEDAGVDTVRELRTRRAGNLHATLLQVAEREGREAPSGEEVERWVTASHDMEAVVEH
jgi:hypothetical protein